MHNVFIKSFQVYGELNENNHAESLEETRPSQTGERENSEEEEEDEEGQRECVSLLKLEPHWTKMMAWNNICQSAIAVPATFSTWCQQLMSQKHGPIQSIRGSFVQRCQSAGVSGIRALDPPQLQR